MPKVCEFHLRGQCRYGVKCWNSHDLETSRQRTVPNASTKTHNRQPSTYARKVVIVDTILKSLPQKMPPLESAEFLEQKRLFELNERSFESTDTSIAPLQVYDHCASPAQSTSSTSTNALIAQDHSERLAQSTSTTSTNALIAQDHSGRLAQSTSTSTTITNALITQLGIQDNCSRPSQSTSTSTNSTNALITQLGIQDNCSRPSQSTSTSTNSTNSLITQVQEQELQSQLEASTRPILKQPDNSKIAMEMVANKLSVAMKKESGNSEKETASNSHALNQKKMEKSTDNHQYSMWDDILLSAFDSELLCNICFEIFIKPTVLSCSHTFCESCILNWTSRVIACPICRMEVRSKSYCLTLESFIEKMIEHFPKEIKDKREAAIQDRNNMRIERPQRATHRFSRRGLSGSMYPQRQVDAAVSPPQHRLPMNRNDDFNTEVLYDESEIFRMNLHDTVISTRGVNPLMSYVVDHEEQTSNRRITRSYNTFTRH